MVDYRKIVIGDILKHPFFGWVVCCPITTVPVEDKIRVMDENGDLFYVLASKCEPLTEEEKKVCWEYWKKATTK